MNKFKELEEELRKDIEHTGSVIKKDKFTTYRNILYKGQLGDFATEYWTQKDWDKHNQYVDKLKADGTYGEPWICELTLLHDPVFDEIQHPKNTTMESYEYKLIDLSNNGKDKLNNRTISITKNR